MVVSASPGARSSLIHSLPQGLLSRRRCISSAALDAQADAQRLQIGLMLDELRKAAGPPVAVCSPSATHLSSNADADADDAHIVVDVAALTPGFVSDMTALLLMPASGAKLHPSSLIRVLHAAAAVTEAEPTVLDLSDRSTVTVVGDLHGCAPSLHRVLDIVGASPTALAGTVVFNGDFVDRGEKSTEVLASLAMLKLCHRDDVVLLRGNHEDELLATAYGFKDELLTKYRDHPSQHSALWAAAVRLFSSLPLAARTHDSFIMHGGLPSETFQIDDLVRVRPAERAAMPSVVQPIDTHEPPPPPPPTSDSPGPSSMHPPQPSPPQPSPPQPSPPQPSPLQPSSAETAALMRSVLWSDPGDGLGVLINEPRGGAGVLFGDDVTLSFLRRHGLRRLVRSHQVG